MLHGLCYGLHCDLVIVVDLGLGCFGLFLSVIDLGMV